MKKKLLFLLVLFWGAGSAHAQSSFMRQYYPQHQQESLNTFIQNFPFHSYLKQVEFTDLKTLQEDRLFLYRKKGDGDLFLYHLGENFMRLYPVYEGQYLPKIQIGEVFLKAELPIGNKAKEIYRTIGYFVLGKVAQKVGADIRAKKLDPARGEGKKVVSRLQANKVYASYEPGTLSKLKKNLKQGNYPYVIQRMWFKFQEIFHPFGRLAGEGIYPLILIILIFLGTRLFFGGVGRLFGKKFNTSFWVSLVLLLLLFGVPQVLSRGENPSQGQPLNSNLRLLSYKHYYPLSRRTFGVDVMKVKDKNGKELGEAIWMHRPQLKASYLAHQNVSGRYRNFRKGRRVVLATSGGFTNSLRQPEGLTVEQGNIVNAVLMPDRDGLVMVQPSGGIRILNLKRQEFFLPLGRKQVKKIGNPLQSLIAYSELLEWCRSTRATLFQTQLLAYSDQMLIQRSKATTNLRERRLLALMSDARTGQTHHAIFNIKQSVNLAEISEEIFALIADRNKKVEAILNLDVGSYNILETYDERGRPIRGAWGPVSVSEATNLIVYYY
jgi:hypothetical protein